MGWSSIYERGGVEFVNRSGVTFVNRGGVTFVNRGDISAWGGGTFVNGVG